MGEYQGLANSVFTKKQDVGVSLGIHRAAQEKSVGGQPKTGIQLTAHFGCDWRRSPGQPRRTLGAISGAHPAKLRFALRPRAL